MLARLLEIECVADVAVDRSGTYLRIGVRDGKTSGCVETVSAWLEREGVFVESAESGIEPDRWYGPAQVRELSLAEAEELAARTVAAVEPPPDAPTARRLREVIARHLHGAFVTHHLERGERVPLRVTVEKIRADSSSALTVEQLESFMKHLESTLHVPEAG